MTNDYGLTDGAYTLIESLITNEDGIKSISSNFKDERLWKILVAEQVRRAHKFKLAPQKALYLSGPDVLSMPFPIHEWGGQVHTPYEGILGCDLMILFNKPTQPFRYRFIWNYFLSNEDVECDEKKRFKKINKVDNWVLYQSTLAYEPVYLLGQSNTRTSIQ